MIIIIIIIIIILKETIYIKTIIQVNENKVKYIITACIPIIMIKKNLLFIKKIYKKISSPRSYKEFFCSLNIRIVNPTLNLSLNELRLTAEHRNISDSENKSAKDLIKALRGSKPKLGIKKNKLKEIKEDFYNLRHKFSKKISST